MAPNISFCATADSVKHAVSSLSSQSVILVDSQAHEMGRPGGTLSLITLSDPLAQHVFLIDLLAFPSPPPPQDPTFGTPPTNPRPHPGLAPVLALLSLPHITKVFWDGRGRALEFRLTYGLVLSNVLDLQLVDVAARARKVRAGKLSPDLINAKGYFKSMRADVESNPAAYAGIYMLRGITHVVGWYQLVPKESKDHALLNHPAVDTAHQNGGSPLWLARPLPAPYLTYAAHDLTLIALLYAHFMRQQWVPRRLPALRAQSAVFMEMLTSREENERLGELKLKRFMPLGIIDEDGDREGGGRRTRYACGCCRRGLSADCFVKMVRSGKVMRLSYCRLCNAVAERNKRPQGEWVDL